MASRLAHWPKFNHGTPLLARWLLARAIRPSATAVHPLNFFHAGSPSLPKPATFHDASTRLRTSSYRWDSPCPGVAAKSGRNGGCHRGLSGLSLSSTKALSTGLPAVWIPDCVRPREVAIRPRKPESSAISSAFFAIGVFRRRIYKSNAKISSSRDQGGLRLPRRGSSASGSGILFPGKVDFRRIVWERER